MADYIYLLETRLSKAQRAALDAVREVARARATMLFLVGGAVRDLTSGSPVRDLDVVVQGNALKMRKDLEKAGAVLMGENDPGQALHLSFPGSVRVEVGSTLSATYPKPGKPVYKPASLQEDLRRRDFTANAMALSLNEGSYGLLMDPLNGVADIENRELRLTNSYGFIEDPARMIRAARMMARLGWTMEEKTQARYETGKQEGYISTLSSFQKGYELEEIFHEEDPLRVMRRLEEEGWMQFLYPALAVAKANLPEIERLRETQTQLQVQGISTDASAANFPLLTGKLSAAEIRELKEMFPRHGFVTQIEGLDAEGKEFAAQLLAKAASLPSQAFQLIHRSKPEAVLWAAHTSKSMALQNKLKSFYGEWPQARQKIPYLLMQEMRIVPELPAYQEIAESLFFALMDGRLGTIEEMRAFLEPHSPPAPPPPVHLRRQRTAKKDAKGGKGRKKAVASVEADDDEDADTDADDVQSGEDAEDADAIADSKDVTEEVTEVEAKELDEIEPATEVAAAKPVPATGSVEAADGAVHGSPSPVRREEAATAPRHALVASKGTRVRSEKGKAAAPAEAEASPKPTAPVRMASAPAKAVAPVKATRPSVSVPPAKKAAPPASDRRPAAKAAVSPASRPASGKKPSSKAPSKSLPPAKKSAAAAKKTVPAKAVVAKKAAPAKAAPAPKKAGAKAPPAPAKKAAKKSR